MTTLINNFPNYSLTKEGVITNIATGLIKSNWLGKNGYFHVDLYDKGTNKKVSIHRLLALHFIPNPENKRTVNHIDGNKQNNCLSNLEWATDSENCQHAYDTGLQPYRKKATLEEYTDLLINRFLKGETLTAISKDTKNNLSSLSINIRVAAKSAGLLIEYKTELTKQNRLRKKGPTAKIITLQMLDKDSLEVVNTFSTYKEARTYLGKGSTGPISNVIAGRTKTGYGYKWKIV